ncbi:hypothetical protein GGR50DRAFT_609813 [Xylaria sp. CBS 124048]|nr:hypothetical protein GGR50DRAFT_609813 [Xylaria sp. CBS 124048]
MRKKRRLLECRTKCRIGFICLQLRIILSMPTLANYMASSSTYEYKSSSRQKVEIDGHRVEPLPAWLCERGVYCFRRAVASMSFDGLDSDGFSFGIYAKPVPCVRLTVCDEVLLTMYNLCNNTSRQSPSTVMELCSCILGRNIAVLSHTTNLTVLRIHGTPTSRCFRKHQRRSPRLYFLRLIASGTENPSRPPPSTVLLKKLLHPLGVGLFLLTFLFFLDFEVSSLSTPTVQRHRIIS